MNCVESFQTVLDGLTMIISNLCEAASLMTLFSTSGVNSTGLSFLGFSFDVMKVKKKTVKAVY